jgi:uncharacterized protein (TIGR03086 family)
MDTMELYRRAQNGFDAVVAAVRPDQWDEPSMCVDWSVRDVVGHVIWGQHQIRAWATGTASPERTGAPGAPHPGVLTGADPVATWRSARAESTPALTDDALARRTSITGLGEIPLAAVVTLLTTDLAVHTWDVGHALGMRTRLDPALVDVAAEWARSNAVRRPGFFGPELVPPPGSDAQTRMLAFLGRPAWQRVSA